MLHRHEGARRRRCGVRTCAYIRRPLWCNARILPAWQGQEQARAVSTVAARRRRRPASASRFADRVPGTLRLEVTDDRPNRRRSDVEPGDRPALARPHVLLVVRPGIALDPIAVDHAEGVYLYTPEGQRILDFNSQLMSVNIGHGDRRVIDAITAQATRLQYVQPAFVTEVRARLGAKLAEILPGDMDKVFFTLGGAEAIENAIRLARHYSGRHKVLARYRSYHGATLGSMTLTGDSAALGERARDRGRRPLPGHAPLGREGAATGRREPPGSRGRDPVRGRRTRSRRSSSRRSSARTGSSSRPTATSRASASCAIGTGS